MASTLNNATPQKPRHILTLTTEEKRKFLDSFDYIFSDIDGVVWNVYSRIPNAPEAFNDLRAYGKKLYFVTNNSFRPEAQCLQQFRKVNMEIHPDEIIHPVKSIVLYLKERNFEGLIYVVGSDACKDMLRQAGFQITDGPNEVIPDSLQQLADHIFNKDPVRAVIMEADFNLNIMKMMKADLYARHPDCLLIVGATDLMLPVRADINILGPGYFTGIVADASKKEPIVLGKPGKALAELLCRHHHISDPKRALMIGDMLQQDIGLGRQAGFQTLLVLSGATKHTDLDAERNPTIIPDYYADSMADFLTLLKDTNKLHL